MTKSDLMKNLSLLKSEVKSSKGGETVIIIMLTAMIICANIMLVTVNEYIGSVIYFSNPKLQNAVKIHTYNELTDYSAVKDCEESEYSFEVSQYQERFGALYAVSKEFFSEELPFLSKSNIAAVKDIEGEYIPLLVNKETGLSVGDRGQLSDGTEYEVAGIVDEENIQYMLYSATYSEKFAITVGNDRLSNLTPMTNPILFMGLHGNTDIEEFDEKYYSNGFLVSAFEPFDIISNKFSDSITVSVIGIVVFLVSFFAVIINCYLVFCGKRRYYKALITVGGRKKIFLFNGAVIKAVQLLISSVVSILVLVILNILLKGGMITLISGILSVSFALIVTAVTELLLSRWIRKL